MTGILTGATAEAVRLLEYVACDHDSISVSRLLSGGKSTATTYRRVRCVEYHGDLASACKLPREADGFRFVHRIRFSVMVGGQAVVCDTGDREIGPLHLVGVPVSRNYLLSQQGQFPGGVRALREIIDRLDGAGGIAGVRAVRLAGGAYTVAAPADVVVNAEGAEMTTLLEPPDSWIVPAEHAGNVFSVAVAAAGTVLVEARHNGVGLPAVTAYIRLPSMRGEGGASFEVRRPRDQEGPSFAEHRVDDSRTLRFEWTGSALKVRLDHNTP